MKTYSERFDLAHSKMQEAFDEMLSMAKNSKSIEAKRHVCAAALHLSTSTEELAKALRVEESNWGIL